MTIDLTKYPNIKDYHGGGSILNKYTTVGNLLDECQRHAVDPQEVYDLIEAGQEVTILSGEIKGIGPYGV